MATAQQLKKLGELLKSNLTVLKLFRFGEIHISVMLVGRTKDGNLAGELSGWWKAEMPRRRCRGATGIPASVARGFVAGLALATSPPYSKPGGETMKQVMAACLLFLAVGCGNARPDLPTAGLHKSCPDAGSCEQGQTCLEVAGSGGPTFTCELKCSDDSDCPRGTRCNLPPVLPDSIPNTCHSSPSW